jgi:hypothetical protein
MVMPEKWIAFWVDHLFFCMMVDSRKKWEEAKERSHGDVSGLLKMKKNPNSKFPDFGQGIKYTDPLTLGQWAEKNGIKLN